jgi:hypothetical protein
MERQKTIAILALLITLAASLAAATGIFSSEGPGPFTITSIRGEQVDIYGRGIYRHMSAEVAPQGIAQDYVTLFIGVPLLVLSIFWAGKGSLRGRFLLAGVLGYFLVTYLFYLAMGTYNELFLAYAFLLGSTFFAFLLTMLSFDVPRLPALFSPKAPVKFAGGFLLFNTAAIALMWLGIVLPPLLSGAVYPRELEHYTTLIVQGFDLGLLLPISAVCGALMIRKAPFGYLAGPVYLIFLSLLMLALTAKIIAMGMLGYEIIPAIFIIPTFAAVAIGCSVFLLKDIKTPVDS